MAIIIALAPSSVWKRIRHNDIGKILRTVLGVYMGECVSLCVFVCM